MLVEHAYSSDLACRCQCTCRKTVVMNILFTFDRNMIAPLSAALYSLAATNVRSDLELYLVHGFPACDELFRLQTFCNDIELRTQFIEISNNAYSEIWGTLRDEPHISSAALYRCSLGSILPKTVTRVLYLDCDTLVLSSLAELYDRDLGGSIVAAYQVGNALHEDLGVGPSQYFSSGVMLIDLNLWRKQNVEKRVFEVLTTMSDRLVWHDQCALNIALAGQVMGCERRYNYTFYPTRLIGDFEVPVILHFAGSVKPWTAPLKHPWGGIYCEMAGRTPWAEQLDLSPDAGMSPKRRYRRHLLRRFGLHWLARRI